nr:hypothetical protein [Tanacetum cinerariifolium]
MIGWLMYLTTSRPDIAYATFVCARYQACPTVKHLKKVKQIFWYLRRSYNKGLWYSKDSGFELIAYLDANHAGCKDDCKSTSGELEFLGGKLMSWSSKKQDFTAMSTAEAKYVSLSACCAQVIWMRTKLLDYGYKYNRISMYHDSKSAIAISCNPNTNLLKERFEYLVHRISMRCMTPTQLESLKKVIFLRSYIKTLIIIAHQQLVADVHPDEICPPNKWYDLMDANKKIDLEHVQCPPEKLLWEGIHYSLLYSTSSIPYPRFRKIIIGHYMTNFLEISRRARDKYQNLKDDDLMKNIFNSGRYKDKVGMKIPDWMISEEMKQIEHYRMYAQVFRIYIPLIQSPSTEATQGTHRIPSDPRQKQEARENAALVEKHLASKEIKKMVEGQEHVVDDSSILRNDEHNIPDTREKGKNIEESRTTPFLTPIRSSGIHTDLVSSDTEKLQELTGRYGYLFEHLRDKFMPRKSFVTFTDHLYEAMIDSLHTMVDKHIKEQVEKQVPKQVPQTTCRTPAIRLRDQDDPQDDAHPDGRKVQSGRRHQNDDEIPTKQVSQDIMEEVSLNVDKFITKIIARRANDCIMLITKPDFKNLNKNDIEDMYLLIINEKKVNLTATTMSFPEVKKHEMFYIIYEPVHRIVYKSSKKEKRVMRHSEIHKFCDATLNIVLEGLNSYNNDVRYGYNQRDLTKDKAGYLKLFEEEIEDRLKYRRQMRRWESYVNGRPLG